VFEGEVSGVIRSGAFIRFSGERRVDLIGPEEPAPKVKGSTSGRRGGSRRTGTRR
jgi:hypothetical protein